MAKLNILFFCSLFFVLSQAGPPAAPSCTWTQHEGKYLGGLEKSYSRILGLKAAQKICVELMGVRCLGVLCTDPNGYSCSPRFGDPFLTDSDNPKNVAFVKNCEGLQKGMTVMSHFETTMGMSPYMEPAEVVTAREFMVTLKFKAAGATQVVPASWIDVDAEIRDDGTSPHSPAKFAFAENFNFLMRLIQRHPWVLFMGLGMVAVQVGIVAGYFLVSGAEPLELGLLYVLSLMVMNSAELGLGKILRGDPKAEQLRRKANEDAPHADSDGKTPLTIQLTEAARPQDSLS